MIRKTFAMLGAAFALSLALAASPALAETVTVSYATVIGNEGFVIEGKAETCAGSAAFVQIGTNATNVTVWQGGNYAPSSNVCIRVAALVGGVPQTFSGGTDHTMSAALLPAPNSVNVTDP